MNPILQRLNRNNGMNNFNNVLSMLQGNPAAFMDRMQQNPQFKRFMAENQGKSPEQIASEHGIDFNLIKGLLNR